MRVYVRIEIEIKKLQMAAKSEKTAKKISLSKMNTTTLLVCVCLMRTVMENV